MGLIGQWNCTISYCIPTGPTGSRLLAEILLDDVDRGLMSEGVEHCRFVDDFRIFCKTEREAYENLSLLATILMENHGLTLQQHKTRILPIKDFSNIYLNSEEDIEVASLSEKFREILSSVGIYDPYGELDYDSLDPKTQEDINNLNLIAILEEQIVNCEIDVSISRFILRRLAQMGNSDAVDLVMDNINLLYPVFKDIVEYVQSLRNLEPEKKHDLGNRLLELLSNSLVGHLKYHRAWIFNTFTRNREWDNEGQMVSLYNSYPDEYSSRELILAMGRAKQQFWFKTRKQSFADFSPWSKRAFIAAASCLPGDEAKHWFRSIHGRLSLLEQAIIKWAGSKPF